jgi:iron complex outermembrane receptor protein
MKKILAILGLISVIPGFAQQKDTLPDPEIQSTALEEIVIQENRLATPFSKSARDIQVITQKQIEALPAKSLNGVLSYVSGVDIRQRGPFGTQTDISIDGGTSEQTLVLINGVKMIDSQTAHNMMNVPVPLSAIDHIEVLRGAAARVYGINALTGAINIITKKENHSSVSADVQAGSSFKAKEEGDGSGIYGGGSAEFTGIFGSEKQSQLLSLAQSNYNGQRSIRPRRTPVFSITGNMISMTTTVFRQWQATRGAALAPTAFTLHLQTEIQKKLSSHLSSVFPQNIDGAILQSPQESVIAMGKMTTVFIKII